MDKIKLVFAGDFCIRLDGVNHLDEETICRVGAAVSSVTDQYDASIVNVETVFTDTPTPVAKSGPALSSPVMALELLKKMQFKIGAFANNHVCDQGAAQGVRSIQLVKDAGMLTVGAGENLQIANKALQLEIKGKRISILNFAENEFSPATPSTFGFAPIDPYENAKLVKKEKENADFVFVMLHAGNELFPLPRTGVKQLSRQLVDAGADAIIISHPHTPQGIEYYSGKPIVYSLGNFFMSARTTASSMWTLGYLADITIYDDHRVEVTPIPYEFDPAGRWFKLLEGEKKEKFLAYLEELSTIARISDREEYQKYMYAWSICSVKEMWSNFLEEMTQDTSASGEFMYFVRNAFQCESHTEVFRNFFQLYTTDRLHDFDAEIAVIQRLQTRPF